MTAEKGISEAFRYFAADNAVIKREDDTLIVGKENIKAYYSSWDKRKTTVKWTPDFIDVANDGTLAYTYGKYNWKIRDEAGIATEFKGVFHTVWKKQADGNWKYVWD